MAKTLKTAGEPENLVLTELRNRLLLGLSRPILEA